MDPRNGGRRGFEKLIKQLGGLPRTVISETGGGGRHYYFLPPHDGIKKKILAPGVDLLAEGSYAVAPPSRHASGKTYTWLAGREPEHQKIAALPDAWRQFIDADQRPRKEPVAPAGDEIHEGSRNMELTRIAGQLRRSGLAEAEMLAALSSVNQARCRPPLGDEEVARIAHNIGQHSVGVEPQDEGQKIAQAVLDADFGGGSLLRHEADGRFWSFRRGNGPLCPDKILQKTILKFDPDKILVEEVDKNSGSEVFALLQIMQAGDDDLLHFVSEPPNVVNVLNCESGFWRTVQSMYAHTARPPVCDTF